MKKLSLYPSCTDLLHPSLSFHQTLSDDLEKILQTSLLWWRGWSLWRTNYFIVFLYLPYCC